MLFINPYLAQRLAEERMKDALRGAEQKRLIRAAQGPRKVRGWWTSVALTLISLLGLVTRPGSSWVVAERLNSPDKGGTFLALTKSLGSYHPHKRRTIIMKER